MKDDKIIINVVVICISCKKEYKVPVGLEDYRDWKDKGVYAQDVFPYLTAGQRELLISGMCEPCYDTLFAEEEED